MKKNMYYRTVIRRRYAVDEAILNFFLAFSSLPRLLLEVFLRKNMGERYFSLTAGLGIVVILGIVPLMYDGTMSRIFNDYNSETFILKFGSWYVFLVAFLFLCLRRYEEIKRFPSVFDFGRFSLFTGEIFPLFFEFEIGGKKPDIRLVETLLEPGACALIALPLMWLGQPIGIVIFVSSLFYSLSYMGAYRQGDHFIMDKIDEMLYNEEMVSAFVEGRDASETRGVNFYGRRPADPDTRRKLVDGFIDDDTVEAL